MQDIAGISVISRRIGGLDRMCAYQGVLLGLAGWPLGAGCAGTDLRDPAAVAGLAVVGSDRRARPGQPRGNGIEASISAPADGLCRCVLGPAGRPSLSQRVLRRRFSVLPASRSSRTSSARGNPYLKWGIYTCIRAIYGAVAGFAALAVAGDRPRERQACRRDGHCSGRRGNARCRLRCADDATAWWRRWPLHA